MVASLANRTINAFVGGLGLNLFGAWMLTVRGRKSGEPRSVVVNPVDVDGQTYLLSPRGETQWVKNIRSSGVASLKRGRHETSYTVTEVVDPELKLKVMRAYLESWSWQVNKLMGASKGSPDKELRAIIDHHPIFVLLRS